MPFRLPFNATNRFVKKMKKKKEKRNKQLRNQCSLVHYAHSRSVSAVAEKNRANNFSE